MKNIERIDHRCAVEGCATYAPFGVGVSLIKGIIGRWYCRTHLPAELKGWMREAKRRATAADVGVTP